MGLLQDTDRSSRRPCSPCHPATLLTSPRAHARVPLCPQASVAQQLCRQHIIAGQHMLEEAGTQAPRRWWTLAGQEITVSFSRFRVSRGPGLETRGVTGGEHSPGGGVEADRALG